MSYFEDRVDLKIESDYSAHKRNHLIPAESSKDRATNKEYSGPPDSRLLAVIDDSGQAPTSFQYPDRSIGGNCNAGQTLDHSTALGSGYCW